jgi:hypothetical protein
MGLFSLLAVLPAYPAAVTVSGRYELQASTFHVFTFSAVPSLVTISGITFDLGSGLQYDLESGGPGVGPGFGEFLIVDGGTGSSTVTGPISGSNAPVLFSFSGFETGETFTFTGQVDTSTVDFVDFLDNTLFQSSGAADITITFAAIAGYNIIGPNTVNIPGSAFAPGTSRYDWTGTLEVESAVPEPGTLSLAGIAILGATLARRKWRKLA